MLDDVQLFSHLSQKERDILAQHTVSRRYPKNTILINEGDQTDSLYVIHSGEVKVFMSDEQGKEVILAIMGPGEYFGELALIDDEPRAASVMTLAPSQLSILPKSDFQRCLAEYPQISQNLMRALVRRVRSLAANVKSLALMDVYGRVAKTLLDLATEKDGKLVIEQRLTHQDLANMVGASREMVSRIFKDLTRGGYISVDNRVITINDKLPPGW